MDRRPKRRVTPTIAAYADLLLKLHKLIADGKGNAEEADAIRDHMDFHWRTLDSDELEVVRQLSADLNGLKSPNGLHPLDDYYAADFAVEISKAHESENYLRILRLLTERAPEISLGRALILRGMSYRELGLVQAGLTFMWHAATVSDSRESANIIALNTLWHYVDVDVAARCAIDLLRDGQITGIACFVVASLLLTAAAETNGPLRAEYAEASRQLLTNILKSAPRDEAKNAQANCHEMLSNCYFLLGDTPQAIRELGTAIDLTPNDDELYVQRGLIFLDSNFQSAKSDFEMAIKLSTALVWPYYYLAIDAFRSKDFIRCIQLAKTAAPRTPDLELQSRLHELIAMSIASSSSTLTPSSIEAIRNHFRTAMVFSPSDQQILANSKVFENALKSAISQHGWIIRPPVSSQRATSLAMSKRLPDLVACG